MVLPDIAGLKSSPTASSAESSADEPGGMVGIVNRYVNRIFENTPLSPELRRRREATIRQDVLLFIRDIRVGASGGLREAEIEETLVREFGDPLFLREVFLRSDTRVETFDRKTWLILAETVLCAAAVALLLKAAEFQAHWSAPQLASFLSRGISTLLLTLAPLVGIFGYCFHWIRSGNRHRIVPFVLVSTLAFVAAGSVRGEIEILERSPVARSHVLVSVAIPVLSGDLKPMIRRYILDIDRTGLPQRFTRSQVLVSAHEDAPSGLVRFFWLLVVCVVGGNFYAMSRMADDLALLEEIET